MPIVFHTVTKQSMLLPRRYQSVHFEVLLCVCIHFIVLKRNMCIFTFILQLLLGILCINILLMICKVCFFFDVTIYVSYVTIYSMMLPQVFLLFFRIVHINQCSSAFCHMEWLVTKHNQELAFISGHVFNFCFRR